MQFDEGSKKHIFSWFQPKLNHPSFCNITLNIDALPSEAQLAPSLKQFNLYRMSGLIATSKSSCLPEDMMILIKSYLHNKVVEYASIKHVWCESYIQQLNIYKAEDEYDIMSYDIDSNDYLWAKYRLRKIRELFMILQPFLLSE